MLGTNISSNRFLSEYQRTSELLFVESYLAWNIRLIIKASIIALVLVAIFGFILATLHFSNIILFQELHLVVQLLWLSPLFAFLILLACFLLSIQRYYVSYILMNISHIILMFGFLILSLYIFLDVVKSIHLVWMVFLAIIVTLIIEIIVFGFFAPDNFKNALIKAWKAPKKIEQN